MKEIKSEWYASFRNNALNSGHTVIDKTSVAATQAVTGENGFVAPVQKHFKGMPAERRALIESGDLAVVVTKPRAENGKPFRDVITVFPGTRTHY